MLSNVCSIDVYVLWCMKYPCKCHPMHTVRRENQYECKCLQSWIANHNLTQKVTRSTVQPYPWTPTLPPPGPYVCPPQQWENGAQCAPKTQCPFRCWYRYWRQRRRWSWGLQSRQEENSHSDTCVRCFPKDVDRVIRNTEPLSSLLKSPHSHQDSKIEVQSQSLFHTGNYLAHLGTQLFHLWELQLNAQKQCCKCNNWYTNDGNPHALGTWLHTIRWVRTSQKVHTVPWESPDLSILSSKTFTWSIVIFTPVDITQDFQIYDMSITLWMGSLSEVVISSCTLWVCSLLIAIKHTRRKNKIVQYSRRGHVPNIKSNFLRAKYCISLKGQYRSRIGFA